MPVCKSRQEDDRFIEHDQNGPVLRAPGRFDFASPPQLCWLYQNFLC